MPTVGGTDQPGDAKLLVVRDRAAQELHLETRLALEVENAPVSVVDLERGDAAVVRGDALACARFDAKLEPARAGVDSLERHAQRLQARTQLDGLFMQDAAFVLDYQLDGLIVVTALAQRYLGHDLAALQHFAGQVHARDLDIEWVSRLADADRVYRNACGPEFEQARVKRFARAGCTVADHDQPRERLAT
jgi:hypothetical protein